MMKRVLIVVLWLFLIPATMVGLGVTYYLWLEPRVGNSGAEGVAVWGGLFGGAALLGVFSAAFPLRDHFRSVRFSSGGEIAEGERVSTSGVIRPLGPALTAPFSGRACVAYSYEVYRKRSGTTGTGPVTTALWTGFGFTPGAIETARGTIRLLGAPILLVPEGVPDDPERARSHLAGGEYRGKEGRAIALAEYERLFETDCREPVRLDWQHEPSEEILAALEKGWLKEQVVEVGAVVSISGRFSPARNGFGAHGMMWAPELRLGGPSSRLSAAVRRIAIGGGIFLLFNLGVWFFAR